jgi:hypothetical protein
MELIKRPKVPLNPFLIQSQQIQQAENINLEPKIMDLSDSISSASSSPLPTKTGTRRGRPRLTENAELAKQVTPHIIANSNKQKRRAQLRDAQRGLRERKNKHLEELQQRVAELERENTTLKSIFPIVFPNSLDNVEFLTTFTYPSFEQPTPQYPFDFTAGSLAAQDPTFAQISLTYDYDKFVSECILLLIIITNYSIKPIELSPRSRRTNIRTNFKYTLSHPRNANPHPRPNKL